MGYLLLLYLFSVAWAASFTSISTQNVDLTKNCLAGQASAALETCFYLQSALPGQVYLPSNANYSVEVTGTHRLRIHD